MGIQRGAAKRCCVHGPPSSYPSRSCTTVLACDLTPARCGCTRPVGPITSEPGSLQVSHLAHLRFWCAPQQRRRKQTLQNSIPACGRDRDCVGAARARGCLSGSSTGLPHSHLGGVGRTWLSASGRPGALHHAPRVSQASPCHRQLPGGSARVSAHPGYSHAPAWVSCNVSPF